MAKIQDIDIPYLEFAEAAAPGTPASGIVRIYAKSDGSLYQKDDAGTETGLAGSGGGGSDLTIPSGGTVYEFDTTAFTGWSDIGSITKDSDTTRADGLYLESPSNGGIQGIRRTAPSQPFTVTARIDSAVIDTANNTAGIHVCEASPGRIVYLGIVNYGSNDLRVGRRLYTNPTTYSSESVTSNMSISLQAVRGKPLWLRITVTSSSNIATYYSWDGTIWVTLETGLSSGGTITDWGFYVDRNSGSGGAVKLLAPWGHIA